MTEPQPPYPSYDRPPAPAPLPATAAAADPVEAATVDQPATAAGGGKARRWLAGAMLVTVGVVAGGGAAYAFTANPTAEVPGTTGTYGDGRGFGGHRPFDGPPPEGGLSGDTVVPAPQGQDDQGPAGQGTTDPGTTTEGAGTQASGADGESV